MADLRPPANNRQALAYVAQHLRRGGFTDEQACALMPGVSPERFAQLAAEAELTRPARCHPGAACSQRPLCAFCDACLEISLYMRSP